MKKLLLVLASAALLIALAILPTIGGGRIDYPFMLMVDDTLYTCTYEPVPDVQESDILARTTSYTKKKPKKNGQSNIAYDVPYASAQDGLAVQVGEVWYLFE